MRKCRVLNGLKVLWIMCFFIICTQSLWINGVERNFFNPLTEEVKIIEKNECINVDVTYLKILDKKSEEVNNEIKVWTQNWIKEAKDVLEDYKKSGYLCNIMFELFSSYKITSQSKDLLSFYIEYYQFTGGAHGLTTRKAYVVENSNGKKLTLDKLFKEGYDYKSIIDTFIKKDISKNKDKYFDGEEGFKGINKDVKFYIEGNDLVIYYDQYEIAPYASGIPEFKINIKEFKENFLYDKI